MTAVGRPPAVLSSAGVAPVPRSGQGRAIVALTQVYNRHARYRQVDGPTTGTAEEQRGYVQHRHATWSNTRLRATVGEW